MKKVRPATIMSCLFFLLSLTTISCARHGSDTMNEGSMGRNIDSMNQEKMDSSMEKPMDSTSTGGMDAGIKKEMRLAQEKKDGNQTKDPEPVPACGGSHSGRRGCRIGPAHPFPCSTLAFPDAGVSRAARTFFTP